MTYLELPDNTPHQVSFYLAMEEYAARELGDRECFFMWQVGPSVIFGRNQVAEAEIDLDYCRSHGIRTFRRKSGGGCVYADMHNVMLSYITSDEAVGFTFNKYVTLVLHGLRRLGIAASSGGRNDIMVDGRKVSGSAFYHLPGRSIVHGTMLFDTDMENMTRAITPPADKLKAKGVRSVRQRIALLKDYTDITIGGFRREMRQMLCTDTLTLSPGDVAAIRQIETEYLSEDFIFGKNPPHSLVRRARIEGAGSIEARISMHGQTISSIGFTGDFLPGDRPLEQLTAALNGCKLERAALTAALAEGEAAAIRNLTTDGLINLLTENP